VDEGGGEGDEGGGGQHNGAEIQPWCGRIFASSTAWHACIYSKLIAHLCPIFSTISLDHCSSMPNLAPPQPRHGTIFARRNLRAPPGIRAGSPAFERGRARPTAVELRVRPRGTVLIETAQAVMQGRKGSSAQSNDKGTRNPPPTPTHLTTPPPHTARPASSLCRSAPQCLRPRQPQPGRSDSSRAGLAAGPGPSRRPDSEP
jgi:hypothetical protein